MDPVPTTRSSIRAFTHAAVVYRAPVLRLGLIAASGLFLAYTSTAAAQDDDPALSPEDERARVHFQAGLSYYEEGAYEQAAEEFERARALSDRPEMLLNLALVEERLGRYEEAADHIAQYLLEAEAVDDRENLERRITHLRRRALEREQPPGAESSPAQQGADESGSGRTVGLALSFGIASAGLLTYGVLGGLALSERRSLETGCGDTASCNDDVSRLRALSLGADVGLAVAAAGAVAGLLVLLLVDDSDPKPTSARLVTPWATADGGGLVYQVSF